MSPTDLLMIISGLLHIQKMMGRLIIICMTEQQRKQNLSSQTGKILKLQSFQKCIL